MWNLTKILPRLSEICLYENIVCFLQDLSSSCQSNHIIFNSCQDLARSYKFKEDLGKILNFEKATVHWFTGWWLNCSHIQPPKTFLFFSFAPVRILYVPPHSYVFVSVFWLAACGKSIPFPTLETQILLCLWFSFLITD